MPNLQNFDPVWCGKFMKLRAVGSVVAVVAAAAIMLAFDRPEGWKIPGKAGQSLWTLIILIVGPAAIVAVYQARNWDAMAQRIIHGTPSETKFPPTLFEKIASKHEPDPVTFEYNKLFVVLSIGWVLFCASPLVISLWLVLRRTN
jgi:hypothetical protein